VKNDIRCCSCGKKLAEAILKDGELSIKCSCGVTNRVTASSEKKEKRREREKAEHTRFPTDWNARNGVHTSENY
jgi:phage FluMu protein Com